MDANALINLEEFVYADCIAINQSTLIAFRIVEGAMCLCRDVPIDESDLTSVFQNFSIEIEGAVYFGGEISAHGSGGFFCKKIDNQVAWVVLSLESGPFIGVEFDGAEVQFLTGAGCRWVVINDNLENVVVRQSIR